MGHGETRGTDGRKKRLIERLCPFSVRGVLDAGSASKTDVIDQDVDAAEGFERPGLPFRTCGAGVAVRSS